LDLNGLRVPQEAEVIVEAYRQTARHRVDCGTVGNLRLPSSIPLEEFSSPEGLLFRVKVVGVGDAEGKLLAAGDRIPPTTDEEKGGMVPILPFRPSPDLGQQLWQLDIDGEEPVLVINSGVGDWKEFALHPFFQALVFPELVRRIALWVLENEEDAEEGVGAAANWRSLLADLGKDPVQDRPAEEEREEWARDASEAFSRRYKFLDRIIPLIGSEGVGS
jgi:hypothetical protein